MRSDALLVGHNENPVPFVIGKLMIGQWAVESQWGAKPAGHANYFGIKKAARHEMCCTVTTHEVINGVSKVIDLEFADYPSLADS